MGRPGPGTTATGAHSRQPTVGHARREGITFSAQLQGPIKTLALVGCGMVREGEQWSDTENLLHRPQQRAVRVMDAVRVAVSFGQWREQNQTDRAVAVFVPDQEERSVVPKSGGRQNGGQLAGEPVVALFLF